MEITVNGIRHTVKQHARQGRLLDYLRDELGLTGTRYGCGIGQCGACTVLIGNDAIRSCLTTVASVADKPIVTIEGLAVTTPGAALHPVQQAFIDEQVPQCGFCASGQIMSMVGLFLKHPAPSEQAFERTMSGNLCRCGTYPRIRLAAQRVKGLSNGE